MGYVRHLKLTKNCNGQAVECGVRLKGGDMTVYCVSYDLNKAGQNYSDLYEELKKSPSWWHYLDSTWLIYTAETADQLSERLRKNLDNNDNLLVIKVVRSYAGWLPKKAWEWIDKHVTDR